MSSRNKVKSHVRRPMVAVKARWKPDRGSPGRRWFGILRAAVQDDRDARGQAPDLSVDEVLDWADAFHARTGEWPTAESGRVPESPGETWLLIEAALTFGLRGLSSGGTLPRLLAEYRGRYNRGDQNFSIIQILAWADAHRAQTGDWPSHASGSVSGAGGLTWSAVDSALRMGKGGLPGGSSVFQLLIQERGVLPYVPLYEDQILGWADAFHARNGRWPSAISGPISEAPEENWAAVNLALELGHRGLPGGSSVARLLIERRGSRSPGYLPPLDFAQILAWADAFHARTGQWPTERSGPVAEAPAENWRTLYLSLRQGTRGLPPGWSLTRLLAQERGVHSKAHRPRMTIPQILQWADAYHDRHGKWPTDSSASIPEAPGETWNCVKRALYSGLRGLPGGTTLAKLLRDERGVPHSQDLVPLTVECILSWADAHHSRTGKWPGSDAGPILESPGDTWLKVNDALTRGSRGLEGRSSLARLLEAERGRRHCGRVPKLTIPQILAWADSFRARRGRWPTARSGPIPEAPGENWASVGNALRTGRRGLPGGSSIPRLLIDQRGARNRMQPPELTVPQILAWVDAFHARHDRWPDPSSGPIPEAPPGETWCSVDWALQAGKRGLPGGSSIPRLLAYQRGVPNRVSRPKLALPQILAWADAFRVRTGRWPTWGSGPIPEAPTENWCAVGSALRKGQRGLPSGLSLARLENQKRPAKPSCG